MSNSERSNSPVSPPLRTWDFMETVLVGLIAYGVYLLTSGLTLGFVAGLQGARTVSAISFHAYGAAYIVACPLTIAVLWVAIRMARRDFAEYLALNWPSPSEFMRALAIMGLLLFVEGWAITYFGAAQDSPNPYLRPGRTDGFLILMIGVCIAGPLMEEFVFRGFIFRGWSESFLGPRGAIVATSIAWAAIHTQYNWFGRFWIFAMGLVLGYFRWRRHSTWLTVMVHSAANTAVFFALGLRL